MSDVPTKHCTKCGEEFPATSEYFHQSSQIKSGLIARCKNCIRTYRQANAEHRHEKCREWRQANSEHVREYRQRNAEYAHEYRREWYQKNPDYNRKWYQQNKEYVREQGVKYRQANAEYIRERKRKYYQANIEHVREYHRLWYRKNKKYAYEEHRKYYQRNREIFLAANTRRRARKRASEGTHTAADIQAQLKRQKGRCYYAACGHCKLGDKYHVEHVVPLDRGGSNDPSNIVISCPSCNLRKQTKLPHEWPEGGRLL